MMPTHRSARLEMFSSMRAGSMRARSLRMLLGVALACALAVPALSPLPLAARQGPPPPLEARPVAFPPVERFTLDNGLEVVVLSYGTQPIASAALYVRGGSASVAPEQAGLAGLVSNVLTKGTESRSAIDIAEAIEGVGGSLAAGASADFLNLSTIVLVEHFDAAVELLADVAMNASFPEDEIELVRRQTLSSLQAQRGQPGAIANRTFNRILHGASSPYGASPVPETIESITRDDLVAFRDRVLKPYGALLLVAGAVDRSEVEEIARRHFSDWTGSPGAPVEVPAVAESADTRIHLVHRPGSVQSAIVVGNHAATNRHPDVVPMDVANRILGGGSDSRLFQILREEKGWTYGAYSGFSRSIERGVFTATAEVRTEVTDSATVEILNQIRRMRDEEVPSEELDAARGYMAGSFPLQMETANQVAARVASTLLAGRPLDDIAERPLRILGTSSDDVRAAAREQMHPDRAVIVIVGDATELMEVLEPIAPMTLVDIDGDPLDPAELFAAGNDEHAPWDAARLEEGTRRYDLVVEGNPMGSASYDLRRDGDEWVSVTRVTSPGGSQETELRFGASDFAPISVRQTQSIGPFQIDVDLRVEDGRFVGSVDLPEQLGGARDVDQPTGGLLFPGMDELALAASDLSEGVTIRIPYLDVVQGERVTLEARVVGRDEVEVPAGTYDCWQVEVTGGEMGTVTLYLRVDAPHILVLQRFEGQPISLELAGTSPL